jgi:hypothetical protein
MRFGPTVQDRNGTLFRAWRADMQAKQGYRQKSSDFPGETYIFVMLP